MAAEPNVLRFQHTAMATLYEIRCTHADDRYARQAARAAFEAVDRLELQLSRFIENSDISQINALAPGDETKVSIETLECLQLAKLVFEQTGGAFDPSVGTGFDQLEIDRSAFVVRAHADGVRLDLGAIGKGYAVDRIAEILEDWEVTAALIDSGSSSVVALDPPDGLEAWPLTLSMPGGTNDVFARVGAHQVAFGASGIRKRDHIRDPRTGAPVTARQGAWLAGDRDVLGGVGLEAGAGASPAAVADALSTAFMMMPEEAIEGYCQAHGVQAWILGQGVTHFPRDQEATRSTELS